MSITTIAIIYDIAILIAIALILTFVTLWLRAEWKYFKLGGKTWVFRAPKGKIGQRSKCQKAEIETKQEEKI